MCIYEYPLYYVLERTQRLDVDAEMHMYTEQSVARVPFYDLNWTPWREFFLFPCEMHEGEHCTIKTVTRKGRSNSEPAVSFDPVTCSAWAGKRAWSNGRGSFSSCSLESIPGSPASSTTPTRVLRLPSLHPKLKCLRPPTCPISMSIRHDPFCPSWRKGRFLSWLLYKLLGLCHRLRGAMYRHAVRERSRGHKPRYAYLK